MNIFKGQKENKRPIKCPLMDNKGHFHFELSFKGHVNKKVLPAPLGNAVGINFVPKVSNSLALDMNEGQKSR